MKVTCEGKTLDAEVSVHRFKNFVTAVLSINGQEVSLSDTRRARYKLVEASSSEREVLQGWGYRFEGL